MSAPATRQDSELEIFPSLARNVVFALTAIGLSVMFVHLGKSGQTSPLPAYLGAAVLTIGAVVLLASHLPGASVLRLTCDGFEVRELFQSKDYLWRDVTPFTLKRRLFGKAIEFGHAIDGGQRFQAMTLPSGYSVPVHRLAQLMNEWRDRAVESAGPDSR